MSRLEITGLMMGIIMLSGCETTTQKHIDPLEDGSVDTDADADADTDSNGHWDSDRNGWLPPTSSTDFNRVGGAHNIHMGSVDGPLGQARVGAWSAGCQVIPGSANWDEFITTAWTADDDVVNYFLVDARDIEPEVVYLVTIDTYGTLSVQVDCTEPVDIDIHLLEGDDANACVKRAHTSFSYDITPGRYLIVADTYVDGTTLLDGPYTLSVSLE
jgi:hypothetical protein